MEEQVFLQSNIIHTLREDNEEMSKAIKKQEEQIAGLRVRFECLLCRNRVTAWINRSKS
jgi:hypothetical protein